MTAIGAGVSLQGIFIEPWMLTFNLAVGTVLADVGKAVTLDPTGANKVKLAGDGDNIIGRLETVEDRTIEGILVGTVSLQGALKLPKKTGETVNVGDQVQGAGAGEVKALPVSDDTPAGGGNIPIAATSHNRNNYVVQTIGTTHVVVILK